METPTPIDRELRQMFGATSVQLMHLATEHSRKGNEAAKQEALNIALIAFSKEHQLQPLVPEDWELFTVLAPMVTSALTAARDV
jgi:hypothetical protein